MQLLTSYDMFVLVETKCDDLDIEFIDKVFVQVGFKVFMKNRHKVARYKSGGIIIGIRQDIAKHCKVHQTKCKSVLWVALDKSVFHTEKDIIFGGVYIPPEGTRYAKNHVFTDIESELLQLTRRKDVSICLLGDFNSHTGHLKDFISLDNVVGDQVNIDLETRDLLDAEEQLASLGVLRERVSQDKHHSNNYGNKLIELCKSHALYILNGRVGKDQYTGALTCKNSTVVDYVIGSASLISMVHEFEVLTFDHMYSDVHCGLSLTLKIYRRKLHGPHNQELLNDTVLNETVTQVGKFIWHKEKMVDFVNAMSLEKVDEILQMFESDGTSVDAVVENIEALFMGSATTTLKKVGTKRKRPGTPHCAWFDRDCKENRILYCRAKDAYRRSKSAANFDDLQRISKQYKKTIAQAKSRDRKAFLAKLRETKSTDPKTYWRLLRGSKGTDKASAVSMESFFNHFKGLNLEQNDPVSDPSNGNDNIDISVDQLDIHSLENSITQEEIRNVVKGLKNGKAAGIDGVLNEYLKCTIDQMLPVYEKLFNLVLTSGEVPKSWATAMIVPLYKNKGDPKCPDNYRGISLLSCLGKLFTAILNSRLTLFVEENGILLENQAGFRKKYSTIDHVYTLKSLLDLYFSQKKKLFCAFVDYAKAFDSIWRTGLWLKLTRCNISGKVLTVLQNLYKDIKSCVYLNGSRSDFFGCMSGVRQGENLSPFLFSIFVNDMEEFFVNKGVPYLKLHNNELNAMLKLMIMMYADDTVIVTESAADLQKALCALEDYCKQWRLNVNVSKTKIMIFSKRKVKASVYSFTFEGVNIEIVYEFKYLGVLFSYNGSFCKCRKLLYDQALKAMYALLKQNRCLGLPIDIQFELFDRMVVPVLLYACEVWGVENLDLVEKLHMRYCKYVLSLKMTTPSVMIYGETGRYPVSISVKCRMLGYWIRLIQGKNKKLDVTMYNLMYQKLQDQSFSSSWLLSVKGILDSCGYSNIWADQHVPNGGWLIASVRRTLQDHFIQDWQSKIQGSEKCLNYRIFKHTFSCEDYLLMLPHNLRHALCRLRTVNHKLPIERGRYSNLPRYRRTCNLCDKNLLGDEYHFLLECDMLKDLRKKYLPKVYCQRPNTYKLDSLLNGNKSLLLRLSRFITEGFKLII